MIYFLIAVLVIITDQISKYYVVQHFELGESVPVIENIFHWTYILNPGAAFGMMEGSRWLFVIIAILVIGGAMYFWKDIEKEGMFSCLGTSLFTGGALGNVIDRVRQGLVVDFFDFRIWPIFNVADIAICVGVGCIIWSILKTEWLENNKN